MLYEVITDGFSNLQFAQRTNANSHEGNFKSIMPYCLNPGKVIGDTFAGQALRCVGRAQRAGGRALRGRVPAGARVPAAAGGGDRAASYNFV